MNLRTLVSALVLVAPLTHSAPVPMKRAYVNPGSLTEVTRSGDTFSCQSFEGPVLGRVLPPTQSSNEQEQLIAIAAKGPLPGALVSCKPEMQTYLQNVITNSTGAISATHFFTESPFRIANDPDMRRIEGIPLASGR
jgi:hypothetical protein